MAEERDTAQISLTVPLWAKERAQEKAKEMDSTLTQELRKFIKTLALSSLISQTNDYQSIDQSKN